MDDLISRRKAIDALGDMVMNWTDSDYELGQLNQWKADRKAIIDLPSEQSEVVRCKDCKWFNRAGCAIKIVDESDNPTENDFCSFAERKEDE